MSMCSEWGCPQPAFGHGLCSTHYMRAYREDHRRCPQCGKPRKKYQRACDKCGEVLRLRSEAEAKEYAHQWYVVNRDRVLARQAAQRSRDPEGWKRRKVENARAWRTENPERARENARRHWAKKKYGLTLEEMDAILDKGCAICGLKDDPMTRNSRSYSDRLQTLCIDHDHVTGRVRDALCGKCNAGLGQFRDDPVLMRTAAVYIETHMGPMTQLRVA